MTMSESVRNFSLLFSFTLLAQVFQLGLIPILSRIYTEDQFGELGVLVAVSSIYSFFVTLRLENGIIIDTEDRQNAGVTFLFKLALYVLFAGWFLVLVNEALDFIDFGLSESLLLFFVPLIAYINMRYETSLALLNRNNDFKRISRYKLFNSLIYGLIAVSLGYFVPFTLWLVASLIIAKCVLIYRSERKIIGRIKASFMRFTILEKGFFNRNRSLLLFDFPSNLINSIISYIPVIYFAPMYGIGLSGSYFMAMKILQTPISLIGQSFLESYKHHAMFKASTNYARVELFKKIVSGFAFFVVPISVVGVIYIEDLVLVILGKQWEVTAKICRVLIIPVILRLLSYPLSYNLLIYRREKINVIINIIVLLFYASAIICKIEFDHFIVLVALLLALKSLIIVLFSYLSIPHHEL